jgi:hypothetical protein
VRTKDTHLASHLAQLRGRRREPKPIGAIGTTRPLRTSTSSATRVSDEIMSIGRTLYNSTMQLYISTPGKLDEGHVLGHHTVFVLSLLP